MKRMLRYLAESSLTCSNVDCDNHTIDVRTDRTGRKWYGCSPYNPGIITKVLDILRVFYNFVAVGKDKETPAIRLALAKGKVDMEDIIYSA